MISERQGLQHTAYDEAKRWRDTRWPKAEYDVRKDEIKTSGIGSLRLTPQITNQLISLKVDFPAGFKHLLNEEGQRIKFESDSGYHISLTYLPEIDANPALNNRLNSFLFDHFGLHNGVEDIGSKPGKRRRYDKAGISRGGTYELKGDDEFNKALQELVREGTRKDGPSHISLD